MDQPASPRLSAAVILARDGGADLELFMVRRPGSAAAFADAWVFPGGTVHEADRTPLPGEVLAEPAALARLTERGGVPPPDGASALALHRAALRELLEEAGVLLARDAAGDPPGATDVASLRAGHAGGGDLGARLAAAGLGADLAALVPFSHWITPEDRPRRFDTRFFVAVLPPGQAASHCGVETRDGAWVAPRAALGRYAAGDFPLVLPTRMHLQRLTPLRSAAELVGVAASKPIRTVLPGRPVERDDGRWWSQAEGAPGW